MPRSRSVLALVAVQLGMAAFAIPSGIVLLIDPSGSIIGGQFILPRLTAALPFINDFTPIGIWLIAIYGALPVVLAASFVMNKGWAWKVSALLGLVEVSWIAVEIAMFFDLGFTPMYPLVGGIGVLTILASLNPRVRKSLATRKQT